VRIALKNSAWARHGETLAVVVDLRERIELFDPDQHAERLLSLLAAQPRTLAEIHSALEGYGVVTSPDEVKAAVAALDELGLLENADELAYADAEQDERYVSNLAFFGLFSSVGQGRTRFQDRLKDSHVLQLGTGGLGSNTIQSLAGSGIGRLTLLDSDQVELRNFARQFLYRHDQIGQPKVERAADWVRAFDPRIDVRAVTRRVTGPDDLADLLPDVDLVVAGIDTPDAVDRWVNEACLRAGVPFVRGGMLDSRLVYFSVDPGVSACWACMIETAGAADDLDGELRKLLTERPRVNQGIGPAAALVGSLVAFEALRYLTRFTEPVAAGRMAVVDLRNGGVQHTEAWPRNPGCRLCAEAGLRIAATVR